MCTLRSVACALRTVSNARSRDTLDHPNVKPCHDTKFPISTYFHKFSVVIENSLSGQRRIGPLSRHKPPCLVHFRSRHCPWWRLTAQRALSRQRTPCCDLGHPVPALALSRHKTLVATWGQEFLSRVLPNFPRRLVARTQARSCA